MLAALVIGLTAFGFGAAGAATSYVPISGSGSTWSENALDQWISDVQQYGMRINYAGVGSTAGRQAFIDGTVDFAASDIPFQTNPDDGTSAPENPAKGSYAYMPITAGGTVFMYNLMIDGQRVTNLRLSGANIAKIFTGAITNWDNPAIAADNPGLQLPNENIVPVVRSDGAGSSYEFSEWMISQYKSTWDAFCSASGRAPTCGPTSFFPTVPGMIAQSGDLGVAGYVSQSYAAGSIGYVEYSYALNAHFPVAQMLNAAGYYTEPTAQNVAVSLLQAQINTDSTDPATYLTENLQNVYTDPDPRTYPLSSYSYLILPIAVQGQFTTQKGTTLAAFSYYAMCQGQQDSASLGYSPMPINLVQASFTQIAKIPGADVQNINIQSCNNPTFSPSGSNLLATTAPYPAACDKQGPTQCTTGTGGATAPTRVTAPATTVSTASGGSSSATAPTGGPKASSGANKVVSSPTSGGTAGTSTQTSGSTTTGSTAGQATTAPTSAGSTPSDPAVSQLSLAPPSHITPAVLPVGTGWSLAQSIMVGVLVAVLLAIIGPGVLLARRRRGRAL
jgi:phosphate transport system substrate-binding protein